MMQLFDLINQLNTDKFCACNIYDNDTNVFIHRNITHLQILNKFETAEDFFENLKEKGHENLTIQPRRKNGNNFKDDGNEFKISSVVEAKKMEETKVDRLPEKKKKKKKKSKSKDLLGLGMADIFDLKVQARERDNFEKQLDKVTKERDVIQEKYDVIKEEQLLTKYTVQKSDSFNNTLGAAIKQLPLIAQSFGYGANAPGLSGAENQDDQDLSEVQILMIDTVKLLDNDTLTILQSIANKFFDPENEADFFEDLRKVLETHKMISDE